MGRTRARRRRNGSEMPSREAGTTNGWTAPHKVQPPIAARFRFRNLFNDASAGVRGKIVAIYSLLFVFNAAAWLWALLAFHRFPLLLGTALLAYSFGLRHAVDADHIAAIDNVTRKLMQEGKRPVASGADVLARPLDHCGAGLGGHCGHGAGAAASHGRGARHRRRGGHAGVEPVSVCHRGGEHPGAAVDLSRVCARAQRRAVRGRRFRHAAGRPRISAAAFPARCSP